MARAERFAPAGVPLHVTQRGNFRAPVFRGEGDYELYVRLLRLYVRRYGNRVVGYCLMPNHVHLVVIPGHGEGLSAMVQALAGASSRLLNEQMERVGHVWQGSFYSATLGHLHYRTALAYVDLNPVRAGLVKEAAEYRWSSAAAHAGERAYPDFLDRDEFPRCIRSGSGGRFCGRRRIRRWWKSCGTRRGWGGWRAGRSLSSSWRRSRDAG